MAKYTLKPTGEEIVSYNRFVGFQREVAIPLVLIIKKVLGADAQESALATAPLFVPVGIRGYNLTRYSGA